MRSLRARALRVSRRDAASRGRAGARIARGRVPRMPGEAGRVSIDRGRHRGASGDRGPGLARDARLAGAGALSFAASVGLLAFLPRIAKDLGLPDPLTWPVMAIRAALEGLVAI